MKQSKLPFTLFQRYGSRSWNVRFSLGGKQIRKSLETDNEHEAQRRAYEIWGEASYRVKNGLTASVKTFSAFAEEFIELIKQESERGERSQYHPRDWPPVINRYLVGFFGDKPIDTIKEPDIERYKEWRRTYWITGPGKDTQYIHYERNGRLLRRSARHEVPSVSRQRGELVIVRALFEQSMKLGYSPKLEITDIKVRKTVDNNRPSFTPEEYARLIETSLTRICPDPSSKSRQNMHVIADRVKLHSYMEIAAGSGLRPTEMKNLNWGHVVGFKEVRSKALEEQDVRLQVQGKSKYGNVVPHLTIIPSLHMLWDLFEREVGRSPIDSDPVFADAKGVRVASFKKGFAELLKACGLEEDYRGVARTTYSLRHYYISEMIAKGVKVYDVARNTRTSITMIDKHYGQVNVERLKDKLRPDHAKW
ncbi:tyrosine-type recombinase/integrase [Ochrobactrum sp. MYb379]|uniref:tyrosine-type recombinase/integrase n=1 Tax=Ochrobactrum sp. MYb379 TaxID=2745275 RepID=UPI0030ADDD16